MHISRLQNNVGVSMLIIMHIVMYITHVSMLVIMHRSL